MRITLASFIHRISARFSWLLRRILRRLCAAGLLLVPDGAVEVLIGQLQLVLHGDTLAVADPLADHVHGVVLGQFCFAG